MGVLLAIGEAMIELSDAGGGLMRKGFAGDTFNTAYYARLALDQSWQVEFMTGLGRDTASTELAAFIAAKGVSTRFSRIDPRRGVGLYMIHLEGGERSFSYWRDRSAARLLAEDAGLLDRAIAAADLVYLSGITLAILEGAGRQTMLAALSAARRAGKTIAFDPNIRPRLWADAADMRTTIMAAAALSDIVLPGLDDEITHFGDRDGAATIARYREAGAKIVVLKDGAKGAIIATQDGETIVPAARAGRILDTTAAGDSFNGGFLAARLSGRSLAEAGEAGARLAAAVIAHPGAIIDRTNLGL